MKKSTFNIFYVALLLSSCYSQNQYKYFAEYTFAIKQATVNGEKQNTESDLPLAFKDSNLKITLDPQKVGASFTVENLTSKSVKLIWDDSVMIIDGQPHKVYHNGVKFTDISKALPPSIIPAGVTIKEAILPSDLTTFYPGTQYISPSWEQGSILDDFFTRSDEANLSEFKSIVSSYREKDIYDVLLVFEIDGKKHEYFFDLYIKKALIRDQQNNLIN